MFVQVDAKLVCAWCDRVVQEPPKERFVVSHVICPICFKDQMKALEKMRPINGEVPDHSTKTPEDFYIDENGGEG